MSKDEPWFYEAYPDTADLNDDGAIDRTYRDDIEYAGYFHPRRCYRYQDAPPVSLSLFGPVGVATGAQTGAHQHYCDGTLDDAWSGNFLNWATMTRMDLLRQAVYGGYRAAIANGDTSTSNILERAHLPADGHAFAKYYNGPDINELVPYANLKVDGANGGDLDGVDDADEGITLCNVSYKPSGSSQGSTSATPVETPNPAPMLRVVKENYQLWDSNERRQCTWDDENGGNGNSNNSLESRIFAGGTDPATTKQLRTPNNERDHLSRVRVCDPAFFDAAANLEHCTAYAGNRKPEGLLQRYGLGQVKFGLMTGSYAKNLSGGVLRKNVSAVTDEVDTANGTFIPTVGTQPGIIRTLNAMRLFGYAYNGGTYGASATDRIAGGDACTFQLTNINESECRSWGNPLSELYLEAVRYFAISSARAPTAAFNADDSTSMAGLVQDTWAVDPLAGSTEQTSLNIVV